MRRSTALFFCVALILILSGASYAILLEISENANEGGFVGYYGYYYDSEGHIHIYGPLASSVNITSVVEKARQRGWNVTIGHGSKNINAAILFTGENRTKIDLRYYKDENYTSIHSSQFGSAKNNDAWFMDRLRDFFHLEAYNLSISVKNATNVNSYSLTVAGEPDWSTVREYLSSKFSRPSSYRCVQIDKVIEFYGARAHSCGAIEYGIPYAVIKFSRSASVVYSVAVNSFGFAKFNVDTKRELNIYTIQRNFERILSSLGLPPTGVYRFKFKKNYLLELY